MKHMFALKKATSLGSIDFCTTDSSIPNGYCLSVPAVRGQSISLAKRMCECAQGSGTTRVPHVITLVGCPLKLEEQMKKRKNQIKVFCIIDSSTPIGVEHPLQRVEANRYLQENKGAKVLAVLVPRVFHKVKCLPVVRRGYH